MMNLDQAPQTFREDVSVNLRRRDVCMAQQFLHTPQIRAMREQVRCK
jgi:hypothetical protein